jgi:hypothetical protein
VQTAGPVLCTRRVRAGPESASGFARNLEVSFGLVDGELVCHGRSSFHFAALFLRGLHHHGRREQNHADKRCYSHESFWRHINARAG